MISRICDLPLNRSFFLFGPRQTGKSTLVNSAFAKKVWKINLLMTDQFLKYSKHPERLRLEALEKIERDGIRRIFIDEIQRVPELARKYIFDGPVTTVFKEQPKSGSRGVQKEIFRHNPVLGICIEPHNNFKPLFFSVC